MLTSWIRRFGSARLVALAIVSLFLGSVAIDSADARAGRSRGGGFSSFGSRGSRTFDSGSGAARMQPVAPGAAGRNNATGAAGRAGQANRGSWMQRNPLMAGIMGAIAGTVIGAMLMNALGGMGGLGAFMGIFMLILVALAIFAAFRLFKASRQTAYAGGAGNGNRVGNVSPFGAPTNAGSRTYEAPYSADGATSVSNTQTREQGLAAITLEDSSMTSERLHDTLSGRFFQIQEAWSTGDRNTLMAATTKSVYDEFSSDLDDMERRGERNIIKNIVIRSFEVTEAWQEGEWEFVTARINARLLDYTQRGEQVIEGDAVNPTSFSEFWTFVRPRGKGEWRLSAVNQEA